MNARAKKAPATVVSLRRLRAFRFSRARPRAEIEAFAQLLVTHLGKGWSFDVWNSAGWFAAAVSPCGRWKVHPCIDLTGGSVGDFLAFLSPKGVRFGTIGMRGSTPSSAIEAARREARKRIPELVAMLDLCVNA